MQAKDYAPFVQADVVDLRKDSPKAEDQFFVDTQVWYWMTFGRTLQPTYQTHRYPNYILSAIRHGATLYQGGFSLAELIHVIEKQHYDDKVATASIQETFKEFRYAYPKEYEAIAEEVMTMWEQIKTIAKPANLTINVSASTLAAFMLRETRLDGYDLFLLQAMQNAGLQYIITDDIDFSTVPSITVFTANNRMIEAADIASHLIKR